ncbi:MAG: ABC transporter permease, partial [Gemmatimonadales bacterium]
MTTVFHGTGSYVATPMNFGDSTHALPVVVGIVTPTMFELLDVHPAAGRTFDTEEGVANGPAVALVGYEFWQSHLGGRPVLDSTIILNSHPYLVVGVLPARFSFPAGSQVWIPMSVPLTATVVGHVRGTFGATVVARLKEGVTLTHASQAMLLRWQQALMGSSPNAPRYSNLTARIKAVRASGAAMSLQVFIGGNTRPLVTYLLVGVSLIYLIVCANLTGLLLADGLRRRREFMIYEALGEKRARTVYRLLVETGVMCLSGSIAGMVIAVMLVGAFRGLVPEGFTGMRDVIIGSRVIAVAVGSALVATIVIATASATQALSFITPELLRASPGLIHYQGSRAILRRGLVAVQVASATALLVGALLLTRTLYAISTAPLGLTPGPVAETWIRLGGQDIAARTQRISEIVDEIRRAPGVVEAGAANEMPMTNLAAEQRIYTGASSTDSIDARVTYVSPGYLETLQIPISAGRVFDNADGAGGSKVALVNGALARRIGSGFGVDGFIRLPGDRDLYKVVGVVGDVRDDGPIHPMPPHVYLPLSLGAPSDIAILARSTLPASQMTTALRAAAANAGHGQTVYGVQTLTASLQSSLVSTRVATTLSAAMAFFAVLMALIGVYGLITFDIDSRYRELGIRAALGASPGMVLQTV